jgi:hypothetical protein
MATVDAHDVPSDIQKTNSSSSPIHDFFVAYVLYEVPSSMYGEDDEGKKFRKRKVGKFLERRV